METLKPSKKHPASTFLSMLITGFAIMCTISALTFSYLAYRSLHDVQAQDDRRYQSYILAEELRLSSNNLTLMARLYAYTGEEKYLTFFNEILAIRSGDKPRPKNYQQIYWDLVIPAQEHAPFIDGEKRSFISLMRDLNFSDHEFSALKSAEYASNQLAKLEYQAFNIVEQGIAKQDYVNSSERQQALDLLFNTRYLNAKAEIMTYINEFYQLQNKRTELAIEEELNKHYWKATLATISFVLLVLTLAFSLFATSRGEKQFVARLRKEVANRTFELLEKREQLKATLHEMELTRNQLVESEKMASLGNLVSGVAHEVNTPLGISVTLASHLQHETKTLQKQIESGQLKRSSLEEYCHENIENCQILLSNLDRSAELIRSFKQVAVDQSSEAPRKIKISEYIAEVLVNLKPKLKRTDINIKINSDNDEQYIETYPGSIAQIITNLVMNALIHAFDDGEKSGEIMIKLNHQEKHLLMDFSDNGAGMERAVAQKIFEPFFTTKRGNGGSGLGMSIVYNLVVHQLQGKINCHSEVGKGTTFNMQFPITLA